MNEVIRTESALLKYLRPYEHIIFYKTGVIELRDETSGTVRAWTDYMEAVTWLQERRLEELGREYEISVV